MFSDFDIFADVLPAAKRRGIKVYPYLFETSVSDRPTDVPNFVQLVEIDCLGRRGFRPCIRNPHYRTWISSVIEDLCRNFEIDGILWGLERQGPLMTLLEEHTTPACFFYFLMAVGSEFWIYVARGCVGYSQLVV